jgi:GcrA cell cycle regulator
MSFAWPQAAVDLLFRFYVQEGRSAAETARLIGGGVTRNAVLGKALRQGWLRQAPSSGKTLRLGAISQACRGAEPLGSRDPVPTLREIAVASTPRPWTERRAHECAFPMGEPKSLGGQLSCCAPTGGMSPYCPAHQVLMRLPDSMMTQAEHDSILEIARRAA